MTRRPSGEQGFAVVTAVLVTAMVLSLGLALIAFVDSQQQLDQGERQRDSSFNVAEGVLNAETFVVGRQWPTADSPAPVCSSSGTAVAGCPSPGWVAASLGGADYARTAAWNVAVFDNQRPDLGYYQEGVTNAADVPRYDANGDGRIWVRGQGQVTGRAKTLVAQVRLQRTGDEAIDIPHNLITAGKLATSNSGNKVIIDGKGASAAAGAIQLRCTPVTDTACLDIAKEVQISSSSPTGGLATQHAITTAMVDRMRARAQAEGTYFEAGTCPDRADDGESGSLVFIENANCTFTGNGAYHAETNPGILFSYQGMLSFTGTSTFYGLVYAYNNGGLTAMNVVDIHGNATVQGSVIVDGQGGLTVGSSGNAPANLIWDDRYVFQQGTVYTYGSAGVIQSTWREISAPAS
jgi:hypothetical protein